MNLQRQMFQLWRICVPATNAAFSPCSLLSLFRGLQSNRVYQWHAGGWYLNARTLTCLNFLGKWNFWNVYGISDSSTTNYPCDNNSYNYSGEAISGRRKETSNNLRILLRAKAVVKKWRKRGKERNRNRDAALTLSNQYPADVYKLVRNSDM